MVTTECAYNIASGDLIKNVIAE